MRMRLLISGVYWADGVGDLGQGLATNKMAEGSGLEAFFLHSIPSLFCQAQRHRHNDNLNLLEYFEHR